MTWTFIRFVLITAVALLLLLGLSFELGGALYRYNNPPLKRKGLPRYAAPQNRDRLL